MALHGTIEINNKRIGLWQARRTQPLLDDDAENDYECEVTWRAFDQPATRETFSVRHRYSDGAIALAVKVLSEVLHAQPEPATAAGGER